ncbi:MAG: WXG100 family type VII secretion target [Micromonosporaceae bacterium]
MGQPNSVHDPTIQSLISAFEVAMADTNAAQAAVDGVSGSLQWQGAASTEYRNALANWISGLNKVKQGLQMLDTSMQQHLQVSGDTEDMNVSDAKWYA